jgi:hypothetical protein
VHPLEVDELELRAAALTDEEPSSGNVHPLAPRTIEFSIEAPMGDVRVPFSPP